MRLASAGEAPAVEIAIASGPVRTIAGRMKLHSGGTSTTLQSIALRSAPSYTEILTSVTLVAAIARNLPSRSEPRNSRRSTRRRIATRVLLPDGARRRQIDEDRDVRDGARARGRAPRDGALRGARSVARLRPGDHGGHDAPRRPRA